MHQSINFLHGKMRFDKEGKSRALAGGGRYDDLIQLFGGEPAPAVGFAIGLTPLIVFLTDKNLLSKEKIGPEFYIAPVNQQLLQKALPIAQQLRKNGKTVDVDLMRRKLTKQIEYADSIGAKKVIIVGDKDLSENKVTIRDLSTGKEEKVSLTKL